METWDQMVFVIGSYDNFHQPTWEMVDSLEKYPLG